MIPEGWQAVPKEPTERMLTAGNEASLDTSVLMDDARFACERAYWKAMLAASPSPGKDGVPSPGLRDRNVAHDLVEQIKANNDQTFAELIVAEALCVARCEAATLPSSKDGPGEVEAVRVACTAMDVHLSCSYPECSCKQLPVGVRAVLRLSGEG